MKIQKWNKKAPLFEGVLDPIYRDLAQCDVYYIIDKGFAVLNHDPRYHFYRKLGIAEIQDVFVFPDHRRQGIATTLIGHCESQISGDMIGISVPVSPLFGVAQRLYADLGYRPDGNGVTYNRAPVIHNTTQRVDDDLCLMLLKDLNSTRSF